MIPMTGEKVDHWFMMSSPWPMMTSVFVYLCFVLNVGPRYMKYKQPANVKYFMLIYNLCQTIYNCYLVSLMFTTSGGLTYLWTYSCEFDTKRSPHVNVMNVSSWHYLIVKLMDLLDTVFFVLRKKNDQVTFLHVYHHATMVVSCWIHLKYIRGTQGIVIGWINSFVHAVLYSYYFLSALGPSMRKYLWWKKYITRLQIAQFILVILYAFTLLINRCDVHELFTYYVMLQGIVYLSLFVNFYVNAYVLSKKSK